MFNDQIKQFEVSGMSYKHLTIKEREILMFLRAKGYLSGLLRYGWGEIQALFHGS